MKKEDFTGPGNLTEFLKTVLKNRLESLGIDPAKYVVKNFTEAKRKRRQKRRGIHCERVDAEEVEMNSTNQSDSFSIHGGTKGKMKGMLLARMILLVRTMLVWKVTNSTWTEFLQMLIMS